MVVLLGIGDALFQDFKFLLTACGAGVPFSPTQVCVCSTEHRLGFGQLAIKHLLRLK
ncbi:hypothetical protein D3C71_2182980 [compost metagenome]